MPTKSKPRRKPARQVTLPTIDRRVGKPDLPYGAIKDGAPDPSRVIDVAAPDPYSASGVRVTVTASLRDDPLGRLWARKQITEQQYLAGRRLQSLFEQAEVGSVQAMDPGKPVIDGGGQFVEAITDTQRRAVKVLMIVRGTLGASGYELVRDVLGGRLFIEQVARARGDDKRSAFEYLGKRFRECLESCAKLWAATGPDPKRVRDRFTGDAQYAANPELHRAVRRGRHEGRAER